MATADCERRAPAPFSQCNKCAILPMVFSKENFMYPPPVCS